MEVEVEASLAGFPSFGTRKKRNCASPMSILRRLAVVLPVTRYMSTRRSLKHCTSISITKETNQSEPEAERHDIPPDAMGVSLKASVQVLYVLGGCWVHEVRKKGHR